jgi:hypothetical protein
VTITAFLAFGMRRKTRAALDIEQISEPWAEEVRSCIRPAIVEDIPSETNR